MKKRLLSVVMLTVAAIMAFPLYYIVVSTFKTQAEISQHPFALPQTWGLFNYLNVFSKIDIGRGFANTIIITTAAVFLQVLIGSLAAYGMILRKSWFTSFVGTLLLVAFTIPLQATLIPIYRMSAKLGTVNTVHGLVLIYLGSAVFCYFLIVGYMRSVPKELFEAARIDGASHWRIYYAIVLPLIRPILTTVVIFQTMATWNDFLWPNIMLSSTEKRTIVLQVFNANSQFSTNWPMFMTITVIALVPVFVFFLFTQRWIVAGLISGSVKR
ncbi:carbohydrate ABC transporter permease [Trueperella pyogenes]|uniref:carbohydrate ABC transporter permease n=1 Tax=Trueperella pyogenes TaxID=1661 RepID=UPI000DFBA687|nr:carbohydrate ABC transporter permease [Trueperella pyogenes]MBB3025578.1 raffinose/stachyose/melibiose transport system permease protein [Trueperella pyogenes]QIU87140.1 carbohydrate ABC transporter permease [Trueperella pyogenes]WHU60297.1 carbohydrate ABC transporter permease [Trueperella pyogenes]SUO86448.1 Inner membrane ABC transporter permease protein ycjP [Trueperella pyogenes]